MKSRVPFLFAVLATVALLVCAPSALAANAQTPAQAAASADGLSATVSPGANGANATTAPSPKTSLAKAQVKVKKKSIVYNGKKQKPAITVTCASRALKRGTDFTVSYSKNKNAGKARITIKGKGNYTGKKTVAFKIAKAPISKAKAKVSPRKFAYNGKTKHPNVKVKAHKRTLKRGKDYSVSLKRNKKVGTGKVVIKGKGNYRGTKTVTFKILNPKARYTVIGQAGKWRKAVSQGKLAGSTSGEKPLRGIKLKLAKQPFKGSIKYRVHIVGGDWGAVKKNGKAAGSSSKDDAIDAVKIKLTGKMGAHYNVIYRVHTVNYGWSGWGKNAQAVGSLDLDCPIDGMQVYVLAKGKKAPKSDRPKLKEPQLQRCLDILNDASGERELTINKGKISDTHREWLNQYLEDDGNVVSLIAMNPTTGKCVAFSPDRSQFGASVTKAPFVAGLCKYGASDLESGYHAGLLKDTITHSSNSAYATLRSIYGGGYLSDFLHESDVSMSTPDGYGYCSARDIAKFWANIYDYMENGTENVDFYKSLFPTDEDNVIAHGDGYYKAGWMGYQTWTGILFNQGGIYDGCIYGIMTRYSHGGEPEKMWDMIDIVSRMVS